MFEMKDTLDGINIILDIAEEKINKLEDIVKGTTPNETYRKRRIKKH